MRMPAEWEPHAATWLAWPHEDSDWPGKFACVPWIYGEIVARVARKERVRILCNEAGPVREILRKCHVNLHAVDLYETATDRSWTRDTCPIFTLRDSGERVLTDWRFNGWAKYDNWQADDCVGEFIGARLRLDRVQPMHRGKRVVLEGGSIDVNGRGLLLTTEECLLSPVQARNPELTREDMDAVFREYLGVEKTLWLGNGIAGDDTHGHVDDLARFVGTNVIVVASEPDPLDPNHEPLEENRRRLLEMTDQVGRPFWVHTLPMPKPVWFDNQRLPASYANFYIANDLVLVPSFNDPNDIVAIRTLQELFPDREVTGIACTDLVLGLGTLHCMTQQEPAA